MAGGQVMTFRTGFRWAGFLALAVLIGSAPARAQAVPATEEADNPAVEKEAGARPDDVDAKAADAKEIDIKEVEIKEVDIKDLELDWSQLNVDASTLVTTPAELKPRLGPRAGANDGLIWSSRDRPNGSAVSVKQSVSAYGDAKVGADMTLVRQPTTLSELLSEKALNGGNEPQSGGTAWATITAPGAGSLWDKTAVEARLDPSQDQTRLGTSLSKSLELGEQYSLTLQNGYNDPAGGRSGTRWRRSASAKLRDRAIGDAEHERQRYERQRRPESLLHRRQMAAQDWRRTEAVRRRQRLRLDQRDAPRGFQQEHQRHLQAELVNPDRTIDIPAK
jgi:hypothetical protein